MSYAINLAATLNALNVILAQAQQVAKNIMKEGDTRAVVQFAQHYPVGMLTAQELLKESSDKVLYTIEQMRAVLYVLNLESINPATKVWREAVRNASHSVAAIKQMRAHFPQLDIRDAMLVVEAYLEGLFD